MTKILKSKRKSYLQLGVNIWGNAEHLWKNKRKDKYKYTPGQQKKKHKILDRLTTIKNAQLLNRNVEIGYTTSECLPQLKMHYYEPKYSTLLKEKQKLKKYYGYITEKQFHNTYKFATTLTGQIKDNFPSLLEKRLDTIIYRAKFVNSIFYARQLINHGHVSINNKKVNIPSYTVKPNDIIKIYSNQWNNLYKNYNWYLLKESKDSIKPCEYLEINYKIMTVILLHDPILNEIPYPINIDIEKIIAFYSR